MKCTSVEEKMSKNDNPMLEWKFVGVGGRAKGKSFYYYTVMDDEQKLGKTLDALGLETVQDDFTFDIDEVVDARVMGDVYSSRPSTTARQIALAKRRSVIHPDGQRRGGDWRRGGRDPQERQRQEEGGQAEPV